MVKTPIAIEPDDAYATTLRRVVVIAAMAVALGLAMQGLLLGVKLMAGGSAPNFLADLAGGVAWATIVCTGASIGVSLTRVKALAAGLIAAVFAPLAVAVSKAANQIVSSAVGVAGQPAALTTVSLAGLKAVEYGLLGYALARLARGGVMALGPYLGVGAAIGVVFAGVALAIRLTAGTATPPEIFTLAVNEGVFPIGCAAVVYVGALTGRDEK